MTAACLALLVGGALAQGASTTCPGSVLQMTFGGGGALEARVTVGDGSGEVFEVHLTDDGQGVDQVADDGTWCAPLPPLCTSPLTVAVALRGQHRKLVIPLPEDTGDQPRVLVRVGEGGLRGEVVRGGASSSGAAQPGEPSPGTARAVEVPPAAPRLPQPLEEAAPGVAAEPVVVDRWLPLAAEGHEPTPGAGPAPQGERREGQVPSAAALRGWSWGWTLALGLA
ncbi:MAG: hypothetical protein ABIO70_13765, partial [Pseudomonadota bacterium]